MKTFIIIAVIATGIISHSIINTGTALAATATSHLSVIDD